MLAWNLLSGQGAIEARRTVIGKNSVFKNLFVNQETSRSMSIISRRVNSFIVHGGERLPTTFTRTSTTPINSIVSRSRTLFTKNQQICRIPCRSNQVYNINNNNISNANNNTNNFLTTSTRRSYTTLHQSSRAQSGRRRWTALTITLAMCPIITFCLGTWQVSRLRWKVKLIENLEDRMSLEAIPLPKKINLGAVQDFEYRKVKVEGQFRHDQEMLLGPRTRGDGQPGYFLITPFERTNGSKILVRRGWVPRDKKDQSTRLRGLITGIVTVEGLLRTGEQKASSFVPENQPDKNEWYSLDVVTMANRTDAQPVIVEMTLDTPPHLIKSDLLDKDIPVGRSPIVELRNHHLEYIVTWYSLCAATTVMLWVLMRRPPPQKKVTQLLPRHV